MINSLEIFGRNVREVREKKGLSQEELAEECGLHRTYIGGIERGERNVGLLNILRIAAALSVPVSSLFKEMNKPFKSSWVDNACTVLS